MLAVSDYIPHKPPMRLIETIESYADLRVASGASIQADNIFYDEKIQGVPAWVGIEYMAQTAAVWVGLDDERLGRPVEPAFLVSSRQYTAHTPVFAVGARLITRVKVELLDAEIVAFSGSIVDGEGTLLAEALFTAYRPKNVRDYLMFAG